MTSSKSAGAEVDRIRGASKTWELPQFVSAEVKRAGSSIDAACGGGACGRRWPRPAGIGGGGRPTDLGRARAVRSPSIRSVAISVAGPKVTSFAVADAVFAGRTGVAMEQLRWALATGVAPVLITSALASGVRGLGKLITAA